MAFKDTAKNWFKTGLKPTEAQFGSVFDFLRWKDEKVPIADIEGIEEILNDKADREAFETHLTDGNAHAELFAEPTARIAALEAKTDSDNNFKVITGYSLNPATRVLTMDAGWEGIINGIDYTNAAAVPLPAITLAAAGYSRIDLIVFNTDETFVFVPGIETVNTPVKPAKPANTLEATFVTVSDGVVNVPVIPKPKAPVTSVNGMRGDVVLNAINDLVTGGIYSFLSAEQGKVLKTQIDAINTLLTSDNINLDSVQEIVDAIETVQISLSTILVNNLTTGGTTKALTAEQGKTLKGLIDALTTTVNNITSNVVTTNKTIVSTALSAQNTTGMAAYINALTPVLVVAANEIVKYQTSDTGRVFELKLRGRSFGVGQPTITTADVLEITEWMNKDIRLSNYPNTRNDGQLPTNKVLAPDANGNVKLYSIAISPAPWINELVPDSYLPDTTGNIVIHGDFFTPQMCDRVNNPTAIVIGGVATIHYATFKSSQEILVNVTTGSIEGSFSCTLNNGLSTTKEGALLIVLGTVFKPTSADWINVTEPIDVANSGEVAVSQYNIIGSAVLDKNKIKLSASDNFRLNFSFIQTPLGIINEGEEWTPLISLHRVSDSVKVYQFEIQNAPWYGNNTNRYFRYFQSPDQTGVPILDGIMQNGSVPINVTWSFRRVNNVITLYRNMTIVASFSYVETTDMYAVFYVKRQNIINIRYIKLI